MSTRRTTWFWVAFVFALGAGSVSGYILWVTMAAKSLPMGCGSGSGCDAVLGSRWSTWCGLPVSALGLAGYLALAAGLVVMRGRDAASARARTPILFLGVFGLGVIAWFVFLQVAVIRSVCIYCLASHLMGGMSYGAAIMVASHSSPNENRALRPMTAAVGLAILFAVAHVALLPDAVVVQAAEEFVPAEGSSGEGAAVQLGSAPLPRQVKLLNGALFFNLDEVPLLGSMDADQVILELFDYTCKHCRELHGGIHTLLEEHPESVAVAMFPLPLDRGCNPYIQQTPIAHLNACVYAKVSLAVRLSAPEKFPNFHEWLMTGARAPSTRDAKARARQLVGAEAFDTAYRSDKVKEWIQDSITVARAARTHGLPVVVTETQVLTFRDTSPKAFFAQIKELLELNSAAASD